MNSEPRKRPTSCYVTPPLEAGSDFVRLDDAYTPSSDTFSYTNSPIASPVSSVASEHQEVKTPRSTPKVPPKPKPGLFKRLSSRFSRSSSKLAAATASPRDKAHETFDSPSKKVPVAVQVPSSPPENHSLLGRSFSLRSKSIKSPSKSSSTLKIDVKKANDPQSPSLKKSSSIKRTPSLNNTPTLKHSPSFKNSPSLKQSPSVPNSPQLQRSSSTRSSSTLQEPPIILREPTTPKPGYRHSIHGNTFYQSEGPSTPKIPEGSDIESPSSEFFPLSNYSVSSHRLVDISGEIETIQTPTKKTVVQNLSSLDRRFFSIPENSAHTIQSSPSIKRYGSQSKRSDNLTSFSSRSVSDIVTVLPRRDSTTSTKYSPTKYSPSSSFASSRDALGISMSSSHSVSSLIKPTKSLSAAKSESVLKIKIFIEEKTPYRKPEEVEFTALRMRKDKLQNLNELINLVMFKLISKKPDLNLNSVRLLIFFKDKTLNPIVLKKSIDDSKRSEKDSYHSVYLDNEGLMLDYIMAKEKLYIKAQFKS